MSGTNPRNKRTVPPRLQNRIHNNPFAPPPRMRNENPVHPPNNKTLEMSHQGAQIQQSRSGTNPRNKRTAPPRLQNQNHNNPFAPPPRMRNENPVHPPNNEYGYQQSHHADSNFVRSDTNQRISGRSSCHRDRGTRKSNGSENPNAGYFSETNFQKRFPNERIIRVVEETLEPILKFTDFPEGFLMNVLLPCIPSEKAGILVAGVLLCAAKKKGTYQIGKLWRESQLRWTDLFGPRPRMVEDFIKKNKLEFLVIPSNFEAQMTSPNVVETQMTSLNVIKSLTTSPNVVKTQMTSPNVVKTQMTSPNVVKTQMMSPNVVKSQMTSPNVVKTQMTSPNVGKTLMRSPNVLKTQMISSNVVKSQRTSPKVVETRMGIEEVKLNLLKLLEEYVGNEMIYKNIDARYLTFRPTEPTFIRALILAIHEKAISGPNFELNKARLNHRIPLLKGYINHVMHLELQALYALQSLVERLGHPNGLLRQIFETLYGADVIRKETFGTWEFSMDPNEFRGKAAAVTSVKVFLKGLVEADSGKTKSEPKQIPAHVDNESSCCIS